MSYAEFLASKAIRAQERGLSNVPTLAGHLFPFQRSCVEFALRAGSAGNFLSTGLGKTACELEWSAHAADASNGKALILAPLSVGWQIEQEGKRWGYDTRVIRDHGDVKPGINICNYDRLDKLDPAALDAEFSFDFDPCPYPLPHGFDGLTCEWGRSNYVNPPFGSIIHDGKKKGPTAWVRKAIAEQQKGKRVVLVYPVDKWVLMLMKAILGDHAQVRNLGDVKWLATEDGSAGKGTGRHIACFILEPDAAILRARQAADTEGQS